MKLTVLASGLLLAATGAVAAPPAEDASPVEQANESPTASSQVSEEQLGVDHFATPGDFSVAVLGGRPTAFRISQLPGASNEIATLRACMEELDLG